MVGRGAHAVTRAVITDAAFSASLSTDTRMKRYLISMAIRTVCFLGAVVSPLPWNIVFLAGAVVIPGVAVLLGNTKDNRRPAPIPEDAAPIGTLALTSGETISGTVEEDAS